MDQLDVTDAQNLAESVIHSIQQFILQLRGAIVSPALFLQIPAELERVESLASAYNSLRDVLSQELFLFTMDSILHCQESLILEESRSMRDLPPVFDVINTETGPQGHPRFSLSEGFVRNLIDEVGLQNKEIAQLMG